MNKKNIDVHFLQDGDVAIAGRTPLGVYLGFYPKSEEKSKARVHCWHVSSPEMARALAEHFEIIANNLEGASIKNLNDDVRTREVLPQDEKIMVSYREMCAFIHENFCSIKVCHPVHTKAEEILK